MSGKRSGGEAMLQAFGVDHGPGVASPGVSPARGRV